MKKFNHLSKIKETSIKIVKKIIVFVKKHKKICVVVSLTLITAIAIGCVIKTQDTRTPVKTELPKPESTTIVKQDLNTSVSVTGTLISAQTWELTSGLTDVRVRSVKVKVGDRVKEGDIIVELDDSDMNLLVSASKHSVTDKQHSFCYDISNLFFEALFMLMYKTAAFRQFI